MIVMVCVLFAVANGKGRRAERWFDTAVREVLPLVRECGDRFPDFQEVAKRMLEALDTNTFQSGRPPAI